LKNSESWRAQIGRVFAPFYDGLVLNAPCSGQGMKTQEGQTSSYERRIKMLANQIKAYRRIISIVICCFLFAGCAHDFYQQRADMIKARVAAFNANMKADRMEAAIRENEEIEEMASQVAESIRKRDQPLGSNRVDYELKLLKTAVEAAVKNWLALGEHLMLTKKYDQARAAYQRVIGTYTGDAERSYRERAARAKQDIDILSPPTPPTSKTSGL